MSGSSSRAAKGKPATPVPPRNKKGASTAPGRPAASRPAAQPRRSSQVAADARRRRKWLAGASVVVVVVVVAVLIVAKLAGAGSGGAARQPLPAADAATLTSVPLTTLLAGGAKQSVTWPGPPSTPQPPLTSGGKPEMLYIGAEFCPICATQRWPMVVALSHFGTFSNLSKTHSAVSDGDIPTLSFYGSTFTSPYLTFTPVETTTNQPSGSYYKTAGDAYGGSAGALAGQLARRAGDLPVHRYRWQVVAPDLAVSAHRPRGEELQSDPQFGWRQQHHHRGLHRLLRRSPYPEDLQRDRREAGRHLRGVPCRSTGPGLVHLRCLLLRPIGPWSLRPGPAGQPRSA